MTGYGKVHSVAERLPVGLDPRDVRVVEKLGLLLGRNPFSQRFAPGDLAFVILRRLVCRLERHQLHHGGGEVALRHRSGDLRLGKLLGELAIDYDRRRVTVAGRAVTLTPTEYELLRALAQGAGRILTHEDLLRQVWVGRGHGKVKPKIVRAYVKRLRHRLGDDAARPAWIVNERGVGYRMPRPGEAGEP